MAVKTEGQEAGAGAGVSRATARSAFARGTALGLDGLGLQAPKTTRKVSAPRAGRSSSRARDGSRMAETPRGGSVHDSPARKGAPACISQKRGNTL
jgi:hypothetical protein